MNRAQRRRQQRQHVRRHNADTSDLVMLPGVSQPGQVLTWAKHSIGEIRKLADVAGSRVMVSAWCEHIRDQAAATFPFGDSPHLAAAFAQHPTAWFVVATMPRAAEGGHAA